MFVNTNWRALDMGADVTTETAARFLGFAPGTLENWRSQGRGPAFRKVSGSIRYNIADLARFAGINLPALRSPAKVA